jgi:hypothetical protein
MLCSRRILENVPGVSEPCWRGQVGEDPFLLFLLWFPHLVNSRGVLRRREGSYRAVRRRNRQSRVAVQQRVPCAERAGCGNGQRKKRVEVSVRVRVQEKCDTVVAETVLLGFRAV